METQRGSDAPSPRPTPEEASLALREAQQARSSLETIPVPRWFVPAMALLLGGITLSQLLSGLATVVVVLVMAAGMGALIRVYFNKIGIRPRIDEVSGWLVWPPVMVITLLNLTAAVLDLGYGRDWGWIVAAVANTGVMLAYGEWLRRYSRKSA